MLLLLHTKMKSMRVELKLLLDLGGGGGGERGGEGGREEQRLNTGKRSRQVYLIPGR